MAITISTPWNDIFLYLFLKVVISSVGFTVRCQEFAPPPLLSHDRFENFPLVKRSESRLTIAVPSLMIHRHLFAVPTPPDKWSHSQEHDKTLEENFSIFTVVLWRGYTPTLLKPSISTICTVIRVSTNWLLVPYPRQSRGGIIGEKWTFFGVSI
jgi:hypothetical protein